ncbi:hypothetical protein QIS74_09116 [Colletotrichum tabaci]|uniref:Uncharacterized protein n=1 Tax=Colletotrichum tabaci TaxID=1209068 RepID=A0AAV9T527_9PEZI
MYFAPFLALLVAGAALAAAEGCHGDNLLRAMERHNGTAYCSSLLRPSGTGTVLSPRLPSDVPSTYAPSLVSSACSCLLGLNSTSKAPCPSASATATATSTSTICSSRGGGGGGSGTTSSPTAAVSDTLILSTTSRTGFDGGYTYSIPGAGLSTSTGPTCGRDWATTTVQVTETMVSTVYVYSSGASSSGGIRSTGASTSSFSFPSDGDSGGRPAPPTGSPGTASAWVSTFTVGDSTFVSTVSGVPSDSLVVRPPGPTTWTVNGTTVTVTSEKASSLTNTQADGASSWTLSWISTKPANESTVTTSHLTSSAALQDPPVASTVTSDVGGVGSTWIVTVGVTSGPVPFPNTTSTLHSSEAASAAISVVTSIISGVAVTWTAIGGSTVTGPVDSVTLTSAEAAPSRPVSGGFTVITSIVGGVESTWTLIDGSAISPSSSGTMSAPASPTASSLKTASGTFSVITSVFGGVGSTWTMIGGSTFTGSSSTPTTTPPPTASFPVSASLVTSIIDGVASTWTVIGGSTVSGVLGETTSTPTQNATASLITSVFDGVGSTWTLVGGSTVTGSPSTSDTVTPTLPPGASIVTSIIGGIASSWTVIGGSTVFPSTSPALATPTLPPGASVVTSIVGGIASSWTVIGGSTIFESTSATQSTPTLPPGASIVTSIVDGMVSSWTVIGGSTIFASASSALATPTLPPGATVITSVIGGVASSWTVIGGSTIFGSSSPTDAAGATVITSVVGGVASSWTVIGGSTIFGSANNTAGVSPVASPTPSVFTSLVDGVASTWTVIGGSTIFGTLTQPSTSTGNTSTTPSSLSSSSSSSPSSFPPSSATTSSSATPTSGYDSAFTGISVIVARNGSTCYVLPTPTASLHESLLNVTDREPPSIDAFYLDPATNSVKYLRLRDGNANPVLIDVSDPSRLAIVYGAGNVLSIDREGLHFTSANCSPKIDVFISGFFEQLAVLSGQSCRDTDEVPVNGTGGPSSSIPVSKREVLLDARQERSFDVILHLRDQCGDLVRPDLPVSVSLGDTECVVLPGAAGDFVASCAFPGGESNSMECETSVQQTLDHLTQGSLAGMCPSFASVWSLLSRELDRVVNFDNLLRPFIDAGLDLGSDAGRGLRSIIDSFMNLYDFSTSTFQNSTSDAGAGASSRLEDVIEEYGVAAIRTDVCRSLVSSETLVLTFTAGVSTAPVSLANISAVPSPRPEYERTVTDPTALACCPNASRCVVRDGQEFYPPEASIQGSDCLCGTTTEGRGVGFRTGRCVGYNQCSATSPCAGGALCLVGSCCGFSVCVNGTECSAPAVGRRWASLYGSETSGGMF